MTSFIVCMLVLSMHTKMDHNYNTQTPQFVHSSNITLLLQSHAQRHALLSQHQYHHSARLGLYQIPFPRLFTSTTSLSRVVESTIGISHDHIHSSYIGKELHYCFTTGLYKMPASSVHATRTNDVESITNEPIRKF